MKLTHPHPGHFCMKRSDSKQRLVDVYGQSMSDEILESTEVSWFVSRENWGYVAEHIEDGVMVFDFVVDNATDMILLGVDRHANLIPTLLKAVDPVLYSKCDAFRDATDEWVLGGHGCFKSKAGPYILASEDYVFPIELRPLSHRLDRI